MNSQNNLISLISELGSLGENILLDFDPNDFEVGKYFKIDEAIIQITQNMYTLAIISLFLIKIYQKFIKG